MIPLDVLMNMIATEALEDRDESETSSHNNSSPSSTLPPIKYRLELIKKDDGKYEWVE